jgi:hypothetical protein
MNVDIGARRRPALIAAAVLVLLVVAVAVLGQSSVAARPDAAPSVVPAAETAPGGDRGGGAPDRGTPADGEPAPGTGASPGARNADPGGREAAPDGGTGLAEAAGREPAAQDRARIPEAPSGLARAAAQDPGEEAPGQVRRSAPEDRTRGLAERGRTEPGQVFEESTAPGGCLAEYGADGQCLPAVPPSLAQHLEDMRRSGLDPDAMEHRWSCSEVRTYFPDGITVRGGDPQGLDVNGDGLACGPGE